MAETESKEPHVGVRSPSCSESDRLDSISSAQDEVVSPSEFMATCRQNRKRKTSSRLSLTSDSSSSDVWTNVHSCKLYHAEQLRIYYAKTYCRTPVDLLTSLGITIQPFTEQQKDYIERIKSIVTFDDVQLRNGIRAGVTFRPQTYDRLCDNIQRTVEELCSMRTSGNNETLCHARFIYRLVDRVYNFVTSFVTLLTIIKNTELDETVPEGHFCPVLARFAEMCNLRVEHCRIPKKWPGLDVESLPDLYLFQKGTNLDELPFTESQIIASVVQVKKTSDQIKPSGRQDEDKNRPEIFKNLSESVLGQHAEELLLEIRRNHIVKGEIGSEIYLIPGMIVDGTKVFFTVLEMTFDHVSNLLEMNENKEVATIHYSEPLNLIVKEERDILVDSFMMLNNIDFSSSPSS